MTGSKKLFSLATIVPLLLCGLNAKPANAGNISISTGDGLNLIMNSSGGIERVTCSGKTLTASGIGGFFISEHVTSDTYQSIPCKVEKDGAALNLKGHLANKQLRIAATFTLMDDCIEVSGDLNDTSGNDRAIYLEFRLPVNTTGWTWWDSINTKRTVGEGEPCRNNLIPIPAAAGQETGLAMAIPPTHPCVFIGGADEKGLWLRWMFGLAKETKNFPSRAKFRFRIFRVDQKWGFRDALGTYYDWYREYYELPPGQMKTWMHHQTWMHGGDIKESRITDPTQKRFMAYLNLPGKIRDLNLTTGTCLTQEIIVDAINSTERFHGWHTTEDPNFGRQLYFNSMLHDPDATYLIAGIGEHELTFPLNCNPNLYHDKPEAPTQGRFMLDKIRGLFDRGDIESIHFDTVGRWGRFLNHRREHFKYERHPLTFDAAGCVAIYNKFGIYDLMVAVRDLCREKGMRFEGAGMKIYGTRWYDRRFGEKNWIPEDRVLPGIDRDGRWFTGALVDSGWHEGNLKPVALTGYDFERTVVGRKSYRISSGNTYKRDKKVGPSVEEIQRALAQNTAWGMGIPICSSYWKKPGQEGYYETHALYERDKALWDRYLPVNEAMRLAGWQPVTNATVDSEAVICERFGSKPPYYFTVWGPESPERVTLVIEATHLGIDPGTASIKELIEDVTVKCIPGKGRLTLEFPMKKNFTRVIRVE